MGIFRKWSLLAVVVTVKSRNSLAPSNDKRARSRVPGSTGHHCTRGGGLERRGGDSSGQRRDAVFAGVRDIGRGGGAGERRWGGAAGGGQEAGRRRAGRRWGDGGGEEAGRAAGVGEEEGRPEVERS